MNRKKRSEINLLPVSLTATVQQYAAEFIAYLCRDYCVNNSVSPQMTVNYEVSKVEAVNGTAFVTIKANAHVIYQEACGCSCHAKTDMFNESFKVAFVGSGVPTVALTQTPHVNGPEDVRCCNKSNAFSTTTDLTITATF